MARKNIHGKSGVRFKAGWTASKNRSMIRNLVTDLIVFGHVHTTAATGKELVAICDRLITYAKDGSLAARRQAAKFVRTYPIKGIAPTPLGKLFEEFPSIYASRNGGYTRMLKLGNRRGDNAPLVRVELV